MGLLVANGGVANEKPANIHTALVGSCAAHKGCKHLPVDVQVELRRRIEDRTNRPARDVGEIHHIQIAADLRAHFDVAATKNDFARRIAGIDGSDFKVMHAAR